MKKIVFYVVLGVVLSFGLGAYNEVHSTELLNLNCKKAGKDAKVLPTYCGFIPEFGKEKSVFEDSLQVGTFINKIFEDSQGRMWFGTLSNGVAFPAYGKLTYLTTADGLAGNQINGIAEDQKGNMWLATAKGISRYDGKDVKNFKVENEVEENNILSILVDQKGAVWAGTLQGVYRYQNGRFSSFELPNEERKDLAFAVNENAVRSIMEDKEGNIWFARDGYGVYRYDGKGFQSFTQEEGLYSNAVSHLLEDSQGRVWFACEEVAISKRKEGVTNQYSQKGGLCYLKGGSITRISKEQGLFGNSIGSIYEDKAKSIWVASKQYGLFKFKDAEFKYYKGPSDLKLFNDVQSFSQDKHGYYWIGFSGGLFRFDGFNFENITRNWFSC